jgi:inorganic pyrophosphatase
MEQLSVRDQAILEELKKIEELKEVSLDELKFIIEHLKQSEVE